LFWSSMEIIYTANLSTIPEFTVNERTRLRRVCQELSDGFACSPWSRVQGKLYRELVVVTDA
ncbi:MAG: hypothetical protein ACYSUB_23080, partial [Planctomycetota bacterium]|jgi:hypothetical protein